MKTFLKIISVFLIAGFVLSSCEKNWLDVNQDPNNPTEAPADLIFPAGVSEVAGIVGGRYCLVGGIFSQWWTQANSSNQYKGFTSFNITRTDFNNEFEQLYSGALNDLNEVKRQAKASEDWGFY